MGVLDCDFSYEKMLESGDEFKVCDFEGVKLGGMICYDREYPENAGCSCAFSPIPWDREGIPVDNVIIMVDDKTEGIFMAEYNLEELRHYRSREMMGSTFRKVKAYQNY